VHNRPTRELNWIKKTKKDKKICRELNLAPGKEVFAGSQVRDTQKRLFIIKNKKSLLGV
jgi:hypothetical protein